MRSPLSAIYRFFHNESILLCGLRCRRSRSNRLRPRHLEQQHPEAWLVSQPSMVGVQCRLNKFEVHSLHRSFWTSLHPSFCPSLPTLLKGAPPAADAAVVPSPAVTCLHA